MILYKWTVSTQSSNTVKDFSTESLLMAYTNNDGDESIFLGEYNQPSDDTRYWCFQLCDPDHTGGSLAAVFTWDKKTDTILGILDADSDDVRDQNCGASGSDYSVSPSGTYVIVRRDGGSARGFWDINLSSMSYYYNVNSHKDWAVDVDGNDVWVLRFDQVPEGYFAMIYPGTGYVYELMSTQWWGGFHISGHSKNKYGWMFISGEDASGWGYEEIFALELDVDKATASRAPNGQATGEGTRTVLSPAEEPTLWRIAHKYNIANNIPDPPGSQYQNQCPATVSTTGKYIYYCSDWQDTDNYIETYQVELPDSWYQDLNPSPFDYVLGTDVYEKPILSKPDKGETITDSNFHTSITRISDKAIDGYTDSAITPQYPMIDLKNADGSYLLLRGQGANWYLYDGTTFEMVRELSFLQGESGPYWDNNDPDILYFHWGHYAQFRIYGPQFLKYSVSTDTITLVHDFTNDFPEFFTGDNAVPCGSGCYGHYIFKEDYNEPSWNCSYWAFWIKELRAEYGGMPQIRAGFVYDKQTDSIIGIRYPPDITSANKGDFTVSPYGNYVVARRESNDGTCINVWDMTLSNIVSSTCNGGHSDWAIDVDGNEVKVWQDTQYDNYGMYDVKTGVRYGLLFACGGSPYCPGIHLSANNYQTPGWAAISTYAPNGMWSDSQLFMIELDRNKAIWKLEPGQSREMLSPSEDARVWRLAHSHSVGSAYWAQPHATIDHDGKYIYWGSNWDSDGDTIETYMIELPETWYQDLSGPIQNCSELNGSCCSSEQICQGGTPQLSSDCGMLCCVDGTCQTQETCQSLDYQCCDTCERGTEHPQYDGDCGIQFCCGACAPSPALPKIVKTSKTIAIDGNPSEFLEFEPITFSDTILDNTAQVYMTWDDSNLYLAFDVTDSHLNADVTTRDGSGLWQDDTIELYLDTLNNGNTLMQTDDYQFMVNIYNTQGDIRGTGSGKTSSWDSSFSSAVSYSGTINNNADTDTGYAIELAIPWSEIGGTPGNATIMSLDMVVDDEDSSGTTYFDWAGIYPDSISNPERWNEVIFLEAFHPADTDQDGCITMQELLTFIDKWKISSLDVPMWEMMEAIGLWKSGVGCS
jgi:hypothetical protein